MPTINSKPSELWFWPFVIAWFLGAFLWPIALMTWQGRGLVTALLIVAAAVAWCTRNLESEDSAWKQTAIPTILLFPGFFGFAAAPVLVLRLVVRLTQTAWLLWITAFVTGALSLIAFISFTSGLALKRRHAAKTKGQPSEPTVGERVAEQSAVMAIEKAGEFALKRWLDFFLEMF